jgi:hypothetical protein
MRLLSVSVGLLCLSLQLSTALHMVLVEHVRCAEHGEWVHAADAHDEHADLHHDAASLEPGFVAADHPADDSHDHCPTCTERRKSSLQSVALVELVPAGLERSPDRIELRVSHHGARVFPFAPKTSPPV